MLFGLTVVAAALLGNSDSLSVSDRLVYDHLIGSLQRPAPDNIVIVTIDDKSVAELGRWLRDAREAKNLSLDVVEKEIRIRSHYLQALEEEAFDRLPGEVCARGFLRNYARFLGLDPEEAIARYRALVPASEEELSATSR